jgi:hypothetical protein
MALPPQPLLPLLSRFPRERYQGALLTAAVHAFPPDRLGDRPREAAVWLGATHRRLWLAAWDDRDEKSWAVAWGRAADVRLETGWKDILHLGPWRVPLRRSDRKAARALLTRWIASRPDGDPYPTELPLPPAPAPVARGALAVPVALAARTPSGRTERWLAAVETDQTRPVTVFTGSRQAALWVAVSDQRTALVALGPGSAPAWSRTLPPGPLPTGGGAWVVDGARLAPRASRDRVELVDALAAVTDPAERWGLAVRQAFIAGAPDRAVALLAEADAVGAATGLWPHLGQLAHAMRQGPLAVAAAWRALTTDDELDPEAMARLWAAEAPALARSLRGTVSWRRVRASLGALFDRVADCPPTPELLPWPPDTPAEVWATAALLAGRPHVARRLWTGRSARARLADAVLAEATTEIGRAHV